MDNTTQQREKTFSELLRESMKSKDTEEWLDVHFTRPIGLAFALVWKRLGVHPNVVTIISIFLGIAAGYMFYFTDMMHNILGILLLMFANFCDSTDGQLARLTGQKTLAGRILDGFAGDVWFFAIYLAVCLRLMPQPMPLTSVPWNGWIFVLGALAGIFSHSPQSSLADYYRQIHLFFLKGKDGSELNTYAQEHAILESLPKKGAFWARAFYYNYQNYCRSQERRTPAFQRLHQTIIDTYGGMDAVPREVKDAFLKGSRPLMPYTNILTFNTRAICLYATCLLQCPWLYFLLEITVFNILYVYMRKQHETLCLHTIEMITKSNAN